MKKIRPLTVMFLVASTLTAVLGIEPVQAGPSVIHFSHLTWTPSVAGSGPIIHHSDFIIPAASTSGSTGGLAAVLLSVCQLSGDFDIQVSFKLPVWPSANGVTVGLGASGIGVGRFSASSTSPIAPGEYYVFTGEPVSTSDLSGGLRLVRTSIELRGFYLSGAAWVPIGGTIVKNSDNTPFAVLAGAPSDSVFAHVDVKATFSDFIINSGTLVCP